MHRWNQLYAPLIGRILVGGFFLWNGIQGALNFLVTVSSFQSFGIANPTNWVLVAVGIEVIGGIALIAGWKTRTVALCLALYTVLTSTLLGKFATDTEVTLFLQNMAITGGLVYISAFGSGTWE